MYVTLKIRANHHYASARKGEVDLMAH